jgi:hypothetical protein
MLKRFSLALCLGTFATAAAVGTTGCSDAGNLDGQESGAVSSAYTTWDRHELSSVTSISSDVIATAIDSSNNIHAAFVGSIGGATNVYYTKISSAGAVLTAPKLVEAQIFNQDVRRTYSGAVGIGVDGQGNPRVFFVRTMSINEGPAYNELVERTGPSFDDPKSVHTADQIGSIAVAVIGSSTRHVVYASREDEQSIPELVHESTSLQSWTGSTRKVLASTWGSAIDVAVASGKPHVSFRDSSGALRYVTNDGAPPKNLLAAADNGSRPSIAVNSAGLPSIAYVSPSTDVFAIASRAADGAWSTETIRSSAFAGATWTSLHFEAGTIAQITYYNTVSKNLEFARDEPTQWNVDTVHGGMGTVGGSVVDSSGKPHVIYYDPGLKKLRHATGR